MITHVPETAEGAIERFRHHDDIEALAPVLIALYGAADEAEQRLREISDIAHRYRDERDDARAYAAVFERQLHEHGIEPGQPGTPPLRITTLSETRQLPTLPTVTAPPRPADLQPGSSERVVPMPPRQPRLAQVTVGRPARPLSIELSEPSGPTADDLHRSLEGLRHERRRRLFARPRVSA